jgi:hypothetical protein
VWWQIGKAQWHQRPPPGQGRAILWRLLRTKILAKESQAHTGHLNIKEMMTEMEKENQQPQEACEAGRATFNA